MASNLTESSTFDATVTVPSDGDSMSAASVIAAFQALANRSKYLKDVVDVLDPLPNVQNTGNLSASLALGVIAASEITTSRGLVMFDGFVEYDITATSGSPGLLVPGIYRSGFSGVLDQTCYGHVPNAFTGYVRIPLRGVWLLGGDETFGITSNFSTSGVTATVSAYALRAIEYR